MRLYQLLLTILVSLIGAVVAELSLAASQVRNILDAYNSENAVHFGAIFDSIQGLVLYLAMRLLTNDTMC